MISAIPCTACKNRQGSLSTITGSHPMTSPLASWSAHRRQPESATTSRPKKAQELGTLRPTLVRPFAFSPWSLTGCPIRHEPTTTCRLGCLFDLSANHIHTPPCSPLAEVCGLSGSRHPSTLTSDCHRTFTLDITPVTFGLVAALGC
jgi:hypothetical protein